MFQELPLIPDLSVMENIYFNRQPLRRRTVLRRRLRAKTEELFSDLGLQGIDPTRPVRDLSVAGRQFVAIAKVLADDPAVVVLDEATSALGPAEVTWLLERATASAAKGKGVIFISHRLSEVEDVSDRVPCSATAIWSGPGTGAWPPRTSLYRRCWDAASNSFTRYGLLNLAQIPALRPRALLGATAPKRHPGRP